MAQVWSFEVARELICDWSARRVEAAVDRDGLTVSLEALERFIMEQKPGSLAEAERLLDLISVVDITSPTNMSGLCSMTGFGRNDVGRSTSRVEVSFAPCGFGPIVGRA